MGVPLNTPDPTALQAHVAWLEGILLAMDELVVVFDPREHIVFTNHAARQLFGDWTTLSSWPPDAGFFLEPWTRCTPAALPMRQALAGALVRQMELLVRPPTDVANGRWLTFSASPVRLANGDVGGAVLVGRDTTATRDAVTELLNQGLQVQLLQQISAAANDSKEVRGLLYETVSAVCTTTGWPLAHVYLREGPDLVPTHAWFGEGVAGHRPIVEAAMSGSLAADEGLMSSVLLEPRARVVRGLAADETLPHGALLEQAGLRTGVFVPIGIGQEVIGVLTFFLPDESQAPGLYFLDVLDHAAAMVGRFFERRRDRAALESYAQQVQALSLVDELTGLYNRRGFLTLAKQQIRVGQRTKAKHYLIFADIDGMKAINDGLGHAAGDQAIKDVADLLRKTFRDSDVLARLGGDEFVCFAFDTLPESSERIVERFRELLDEHNRAGLRPFKLEVSLGTTLHDPDSPASLETALAEADQQMYRVKRARRPPTAEPA